MYKLFLLLTFFRCLIVPLEALENDNQTKITSEIASYIVGFHNEVRATVSFVKFLKL